MIATGKNIKVEIFIEDSVVEFQKKLNEWLNNCSDTVFDIKYQHCFSAWPTEPYPGVGMEREFSAMVIYGKTEPKYR